MKSTQSRSADIVDTLPAGLVGAEALASGPGCELTFAAELGRAESFRRLDSWGQMSFWFSDICGAAVRMLGSRCSQKEVCKLVQIVQRWWITLFI